MSKISPKRKASDLVDRMSSFQPQNDCVNIPNIKYDGFKMAVKCSMVIADEMLEYLTADGFPLEIKYWEEVRIELNALI